MQGPPPANDQVQSTANNLEQYNGPGFPSVLLTGSNKYIAFTCTTGESASHSSRTGAVTCVSAQMMPSEYGYS